MAVLYSRIVYALWLKRVEDNQPAFQQRVSSSNKTETLNVKEYFACFKLPKGVTFPRGARRNFKKKL